MTDTDYLDDLVLIDNTPGQAYSQLHRLELAARGITFLLNADKTEFLSFKQE